MLARRVRFHRMRGARAGTAAVRPHCVSAAAIGVASRRLAHTAGAATPSPAAAAAHTTDAAAHSASAVSASANTAGAGAAAATSSGGGGSGADRDPTAAALEWSRFHAAAHRPVTPMQRAFLAAGSAVLGVLNTYRGDMIAVLGDTTSGPALRRLHSAMSGSAEGRRVLTLKPRVNTQTLSYAALRALPPDTLGHAYAGFMARNGYSADERTAVRFVADAECAYVLQRYREVHDLFHVLTGLPPSVLGEVAQKWWECVQLHALPVTAISAAVGPARLTHSERVLLAARYIPWALRSANRFTTHPNEPLLGVYWEQHFATPLADVRKRYGIEPAPPLDADASSAAAAYAL